MTSEKNSAHNSSLPKNSTGDNLSLENPTEGNPTQGNPTQGSLLEAKLIDELNRPLADRMRPQHLDEVIGQEHLLAPDKPLRQAIDKGHVHSLVLWGPPGTGKTTIARVFAQHSGCEFESISAVLSGVKDIRAAIERARVNQSQDLQTILFVDEVHRFNKSQQDAFLPHIEDGTIIFIGATTENPAFELNNALLSRLRVYVLKSLTQQAIVRLLKNALSKGVNEPPEVSEEAFTIIANSADGDGRRSLNLLEILLNAGFGETIGAEQANLILSGELNRRFDKGGDAFYDQISALHKSVRGSSPDGALYWYARMLDGGIDPAYIARRVVRIASEDIGNADPRALGIAMDAWEAFRRLGSPEGELAIAQALVYCASAAKSNAVYEAFNAAQALVKARGSDEVPNHLRNAPTKLAKAQGFGQAYRYDHHQPEGFSAGQTYFPDDIGETTIYRPVNRGMEIKIGEKLAKLRAFDAAATKGKD
jgi:putative ATPase